MTDWGMITEYATGEAIGPATAEEWRRSAGKLNSRESDSYTGAWGRDGIAVFVDGGPGAEVSDDDIRSLEQEAGNAGDREQVALCRVALGNRAVADGYFEPARQYRVAGIGRAGRRGDDVIGFFAGPGHELAANGYGVTRDGDDMLLAGAALSYLAAQMAPDDDGFVDDDGLWACGDPFSLTTEMSDWDRGQARAECVRVILDTRVETAASQA